MTGIISPQQKLAAIKELGIFFLLVAVVWVTFSFLIYPMLGIPTAAPVPIRTIFALGLIWWFLKKTDKSWATIGVKAFKPIWLMLVLILVFFAVKLFGLQALSDVISTALELEKSDHSLFSFIHGNLPAYLGGLFVAIFVGGFAEEVVFRGYLMTRFTEILGGTKLALLGALLLQAGIFGLGHFYLGISGIISAGLSAFGFGLFFLLAKRNLWPVIVVHGLWDTMAFTLIYLNGVPST